MEKGLLHILQHTLGLNEYGEGRQYRNHFVAGGDDVRKCRELVSLGHMVERKDNGLTGGSPWFSVTQQGIDFVATNSPARPKLTRSQKRYREYLRADSGLSFAEWIGVA